eukprot:CAMPEP_0204206726 /NCGR_PEP_ID=MMETSP0361-20130328/71254_1 /ASSEMBLY_ACC=CAM_ASM_000343 /TAXON_ID=268821 /ORGANISM="Scrippsiella Hangoei, Strain SHTV-5" /LENGTH=161 /DNA_ID=CAMNT_0051170191 /DNA_START=114 /DNA_END=600 /DNA_ORIENTATION=-
MSGGSFTTGRSSRLCARSTDAARIVTAGSRWSGKSGTSLITWSSPSTSSSSSILSNVLPIWGLGHFSGAECHDSNGARIWPRPPSMVSTTDDVHEDEDEWSGDKDLLRYTVAGTPTSTRSVGGTFGEIHSGKAAGASTSRVGFSAPVASAGSGDDERRVSV